jgi:hypothetical protein
VSPVTNTWHGWLINKGQDRLDQLVRNRTDFGNYGDFDKDRREHFHQDVMYIAGGSSMEYLAGTSQMASGIAEGYVQSMMNLGMGCVAKGGITLAKNTGRSVGTEQGRNAAGRFISKAQGEIAPGLSAVDDLVIQAERNGFDVLGRELTFNTPFGPRRYDVVIRNRNSLQTDG